LDRPLRLRWREGWRLQNPLTTLRSSICALMLAPYSSKDLMIFFFQAFKYLSLKGSIEKDEMQIGGEGIENLLVDMMLKKKHI
jgi:hypothetical protein